MSQSLFRGYPDGVPKKRTDPFEMDIDTLGMDHVPSKLTRRGLLTAAVAGANVSTVQCVSKARSVRNAFGFYPMKYSFTTISFPEKMIDFGEALPKYPIVRSPMMSPASPASAGVTHYHKQFSP
ncbi:hypothetical protein EVAR_25376_1 [Eumeta japonica]|uniref:Uncharacterized protein n=1 Tax=Eumeta variegata TaxID=151549 RepID=A0A4C1V7Q5_EUMVA|nr:hypothetical protein EVAR_25376_1 [Eumeta japonica]